MGDDLATRMHAFMKAAVDPEGTIGAHWSPGAGGRASELVISPEKREAVAELATAHGLTVDGRGRWSAQLDRQHMVLTSSHIPARAAATSISGAMLAWDDAMATGADVIAGIPAYAHLSKLSGVLDVTPTTYFLRLLADALAEQVEDDLVGRTGVAIFGSDPQFTSVTHEHLAGLLVDSTADLPLASASTTGYIATTLDRRALSEACLSALRHSYLIDGARVLAEATIDRVDVSSRAPKPRYARRAVRPDGSHPQIGA